MNKRSFLKTIALAFVASTLQLRLLKPLEVIEFPEARPSAGLTWFLLQWEQEMIKMVGLPPEFFEDYTKRYLS